MSETLIPAVELDPTGEVRAVVIWLHGLGADGNDFLPIVKELGLPEEAGVRFVFPHAPVRPVTVNGGWEMRAWYDLLGTDIAQRQDAAGIRESSTAIGALIEREKALVGSQRIVLAGFSQGGAIALHTGLRYAEQLGGILALSTYVPLADTVEAERAPANSDMPIMMAHGTQDSIVPLGLGERSLRLLQALGYAVEWHAYPMGHSVCMEEVGDIRQWFGAVLNG